MEIEVQITMAKFIFHGYIPYEDGYLAKVTTEGEESISLNIFADNYKDYPELKECHCLMSVGGVATETQFFENEDKYYMLMQEIGNEMKAKDMIPLGTKEEGEIIAEDFEESPHVLYSGTVLEVTPIEEGKEEQFNCILTVETLGMNFQLLLRTEEEIKVGNVVYGIAWLFGDFEQVVEH